MLEKKIALFGGTFDPIHLGHLKMARVAQKELKLDKVIFIPNKKSPLKDQSPVGSAKDRLTMIELALKNDPLFSVSDYEINKFDIDYSYQTALHFKKKFTQSKLYWLLGADQVEQLHLWVEIEKMSRMVYFVAGERNGSRNVNQFLPINVKFLDFDSIVISASDLRKKIYNKQSFKAHIPESVTKYIIKNELYM